MKTEIDTPRTDAAIPHWSTLPHQNGWVPVEFARQIERELNEAKKDSKLLDWLERIMAPGNDYVEVYLAGLRNGDSDAIAYQFEANSRNPSWGLTNGKTLREAINKAIILYENQQKTVL